MSVVPPAANGTTMRTGLLGHVLCARRAARASASAARRQQRPVARRRGMDGAGFMAVSLVFFTLRDTKKRPPEGGLRSASSTASVGVDAGSLDDRAPLGDFGGDELLVLGRLDALVGHDHGAQAFLLLDEVGILQRDLQRVVELLLDVGAAFPWARTGRARW